MNYKYTYESPLGTMIMLGTLSYLTDLFFIDAKQQGKDRISAQAVGGAVGHNPISIIIPCHRVIGSNGKLTGYAGGIERKKYMLDLEAKHK